MKKKNIYFEKIINEPILESDKFFQKIKIKKLLAPIDPKLWPKEWKTVYFKGYPRFEEILLPRPKLAKKVSFKKVLYNRKSIRKFPKKTLSLKKISSLLFYSAGLRKEKHPFIANRFYPSGGARYPLEVYLVSLDTELPNGLYHYYLKHHSLEKLLLFDKFDFKKYFNQPFFSKASCLIIITACFKRTQMKYGERGYNYVMMEVGHLGQNFYLTASALHLGCCAIGGFIEDNLNKLIDIDGFTESVIYILALG